jgi:hypothetical protein
MALIRVAACGPTDNHADRAVIDARQLTRVAAVDRFAECARIVRTTPSSNQTVPAIR